MHTNYKITNLTQNLKIKIKVQYSNVQKI